ncbi:hypothetical protein [Asticcacaulis endophyticus]|uniref:Uncharacterized protein n=1 Tax=Asticcacaulis endophyticus TaxID=1395890 RepID=A0A918Q3M2_9CAUL|nr:hypothetical protein [Asticcacaulis endophyticus]GGZ31840.1 hypothetical protein GCM10011273_17300 [Asticcacaulis endophyticus]
MPPSDYAISLENYAFDSARLAELGLHNFTIPQRHPVKISLSPKNWHLLRSTIPGKLSELGNAPEGYLSERDIALNLDRLMDAAHADGYMKARYDAGLNPLTDEKATVAANHPTPAHPGWLVWNPNGRQPNYQHGSINSAKTEAQRLADTNPDQPFYVYGPLTCYRARRIIEKSKPVPVPLKTEVDLDDEIPF